MREDSSVRVWNAATGEIERVFKEHSLGANSVAFFPDGIRIVSGSHDTTFRIWNTATNGPDDVSEGQSTMVLSVAFSHDGTRMVSGSRDKLVKIWNARTVLEGRPLLPHTMGDGWCLDHTTTSEFGMQRRETLSIC